MPFAVQCPNPRCRKYMLVEERDCAKEVVCLLCKAPFGIEAQQSATLEPSSQEAKNPDEE